MNLKTIRFIDKYIGIPLAYGAFILKKLFAGFFTQGCPGQVNRILIVKFWGIGNIIMLLPAVKALKEKHSSAEIDILTLTSNKNVSEDSRMFNHICSIDTDSVRGFIMSTVEAFLKLRRVNYDLVIDFEQFARFSAIFCSLIGRKKVVGLDIQYKSRAFLYTNTIQYDNHIHMVKTFFSLAELVGVDHKEYLEPINIVYEKQDRSKVLRFLTDKGIREKDVTVVFHIGTSENFSLRRWPLNSFVKLANRLIDSYGVKIIFTGLAEENYLAEDAISCIDRNAFAINACGKLSFSEFVSLIKLSDLVVSADTSAVHVASCLSVPVVGLYGPNTPVLYGPWGKGCTWFYKQLSCSPCITNYNSKMSRCMHPEGQGACMQGISSDEVFEGIKNSYFDTDALYRLEKLAENEKTVKTGK